MAAQYVAKGHKRTRGRLANVNPRAALPDATLVEEVVDPFVSEEVCVNVSPQLVSWESHRLRRSDRSEGRLP